MAHPPEGVALQMVPLFPPLETGLAERLEIVRWFELDDADGWLAALGSSGYLINMSRGSIVDESALIDALEANTIAGAALDVFADEPTVPAALRASDKVVLTPHIASATSETRTAMADLVLANLDAVLNGEKLPTALC